MKLRRLLVATALGAMLVPAASSAQTPPVDGGIDVGGSVPSYIELILTQPATAFSSFARAKTYQLSFDVMITATDSPTLLSVADGDAASGSKLGHLVSGSKRLPLPLEARVGSSAFQPLDQAVDAQLTRWNEAKTREKATVRLRQKVRGKASGSYRKVLLVTASSETP